MDIWLALFAIITGYLSGSLSSARLVARCFAPDTDLSKVSQAIPNTDIVFESDSVSASMVRIKMGTRYGCLTALLDILKVMLPVLAFKLWLPEASYYLITALFGLVGHAWPLYHRMKGGRGESAILGGLLVIDPLGLVVTNLAGILVGWLTGDILVLRWSFLILLIPWFWLWAQEPAFVLFMIACNMIFWTKMIPELVQYYQILKKGGLSTQEEVAADMAMGKKFGRFLDRYGAPNLLRSLLQVVRKKTAVK
jgi:glycerol-3-phosphate acyltransferase PlsY